MMSRSVSRMGAFNALLRVLCEEALEEAACMSGGAEVGVWELFAGVGRLVWLAAFEDERDVSSVLCFPEPFCDGAPVGWESVEGDDDGIGEGALDAGGCLGALVGADFVAGVDEGLHALVRFGLVPMHVEYPGRPLRLASSSYRRQEVDFTIFPDFLEDAYGADFSVYGDGYVRFEFEAVDEALLRAGVGLVEVVDHFADGSALHLDGGLAIREFLHQWGDENRWHLTLPGLDSPVLSRRLHLYYSVSGGRARGTQIG